MHPDCTSGRDCPYQAEWVVSGDLVRFRVSSNVAASNWVAIGFSNDQRMVRHPSHTHTKTMLVCVMYCVACPLRLTQMLLLVLLTEISPSSVTGEKA